jgi:diguanylate cyclase (GGDEF)-like protein
MPEEEASEHWRLLCARRQELTALLGRDPGASVAALDYFSHCGEDLGNPVFVSGPTADRSLRAASLDGLTPLLSLRHFMDLLRREVRRSGRRSRDFSVVLMEIENFGSLVSRKGRAAGDGALKAVAEVLIARLRDADMAARAGGAQFALILPGTRRSGSFVVAERVRSAVEERFRQPDGKEERLLLTLSAGTATFPADGGSPEELLAQASLALGAAQREGGGRVALRDRERRGGMRFRPVGRSLKVRATSGEGGPSLSLEARDVSDTGALLDSGTPLEIGADLGLEFWELFPSPSFRIPARVERQWKTSPPGKEEGYRAGVRFLAKGPDQREALQAVLAALRDRGIEQGDS